MFNSIYSLLDLILMLYKFSVFFYQIRTPNSQLHIQLGDIQRQKTNTHFSFGLAFLLEAPTIFKSSK